MKSLLSLVVLLGALCAITQAAEKPQPAGPYVSETPQWPEPNVSLYAKGGDAAVRSIKAWRMRSIYKPAPAEN